MRLRVLFLILCLLQFLLSPLDTKADDTGDPILFSETGHTLAYNFRTFWEKNGGLSIFGYPLTEVFLEDGRPVQYFERARLEWHGEYGEVMSALLGDWAANKEKDNPAFAPIKNPQQPNYQYFAETQHTLSNGFLQYWQSHGGLPVFGFPLSQEFQEISPQDGKTYTVQYFERARFEYHPENPPAYQVELGQLGKQYLVQDANVPVAALARVNNSAKAWAGILPTHVAIQRINLSADIVEDGFSLQGWDVPRYYAAHYWPVGSFPGNSGNIVIAAHSGYKDFLFDHLPEAKIGDVVTVNVGQTVHKYRIYSIATVLPTDTWVMNPTLTENLTLITCVPIGIFDHRLIVEASPINADN